MDLAMPIMDGIEAIHQITARQPEARILVLTSFTGDDKVFPAIKAGALGYLLKDSEPADLIRAIAQVSRGEPSLHPSIAMQVLQELRRPAQQMHPPNALTAREVEVLSQVAKGLSNREISVQLTTTEATIKTHVSSILSKLHLANRVQAALYALQEGATLGGSEERGR
jgi:NarL family two-component system response regulator LiaR